MTIKTITLNEQQIEWLLQALWDARMYVARPRICDTAWIRHYEVLEEEIKGQLRNQKQ